MEKKIRKYTIIFSIILHLIFFFIAEKTVNFKLLGTGDIPEIVNEPIVFDLSEERPARQVIETTDDQRSEKKADKPKFFSDKNTIAKNSNSSKDLRTGDPYSEGDIESPALPKISTEGKPEKDSEKEKVEPEEDPEENEEDKTEINGQTEKKPDLSRRAMSESIRNQLLHKNILSKVKEVGGFAFNTYDWNFAPYMLELKRRIQSNIFPPLAFSRLGMIDGQTLLRFRIQPDGTLSSLELLSSKGHKTLTDTSMKAVEISAPFLELPEDFPEPFLEVTGKFIYFVKK